MCHACRQELQEVDGHWLSLDHHSRFQGSTARECLAAINSELALGAAELRRCSHLFITLGTAWGYALPAEGPVDLPPPALFLPAFLRSCPIPQPPTEPTPPTVSREGRRWWPHSGKLPPPAVLLLHQVDDSSGGRCRTPGRCHCGLLARQPFPSGDHPSLSPRCLGWLLLPLLAAMGDPQVVLTVSPVRHLRDGFVENSRSKAALLLAVEKVVDRLPDCCYYFPRWRAACGWVGSNFLLSRRRPTRACLPMAGLVCGLLHAAAQLRDADGRFAGLPVLLGGHDPPLDRGY